MKIKNLKLKIKNYLLIGLFVYLLICLFLPTQVQASQLSLGVFPPVLQIQANPPASITHPITIVNNSDDPVTLKIIFKPFQYTASGNGEVFYKEQKDFSSSSNDRFMKSVGVLNDAGNPINQVSLAPRQKSILNLTMNISKDEITSDQYFSVLFITTQPTADQSSQTLVAGGIGMHVLIAIGPEEKPFGYIKTFSVPLFLQKGPVPFSIEVANSSSHYLSTKGNIVIKNMFGQQIGKVDLLPIDILSRGSRFIPDNTERSDTQAFWPEKIIFGPYTATTTIALSDQGPVLTKTAYFFALPIQGIIGLIITILLIVFIVIRVKRRLE